MIDYEEEEAEQLRAEIAKLASGSIEKSKL